MTSISLEEVLFSFNMMTILSSDELYRTSSMLTSKLAIENTSSTYSEIIYHILYTEKAVNINNGTKMNNLLGKKESPPKILK